MLGVLCTAAADARADRLRDLCDVVGVRDNQLLGYGVVTGLNGTGDDASAPFATQSLIALLRRMGVQVDAAQFRLRNVAAVVVTATIPPFAKPGARLDVSVSSIGNARSIQGGVLLQTRLVGADQRVYAIAQGPIVVGGFGATGKSGSSVQKNSTTTARIPGGALVEREIPMSMASAGVVTLALRKPDFLTAHQLADAINGRLGIQAARAVDGGTIQVRSPAQFRDRPVELIASLLDIDVEPAQSARVIVNERTGTIVAGGDVRISPVAISHAGLTIVIRERSEVSQPNPLGDGDTKIVPRSDVKVEEDGQNDSMTFLEGAASLSDVTQALSALGVGPRDLASILQAMHAAGALRAPVEIQ
jgi:flagellar P-ring protein precursor FlgI